MLVLLAPPFPTSPISPRVRSRPPQGSNIRGILPGVKVENIVERGVRLDRMKRVYTSEESGRRRSNRAVVAGVLFGSALLFDARCRVSGLLVNKEAHTPACQGVLGRSRKATGLSRKDPHLVEKTVARRAIGAVLNTTLVVKREGSVDGLMRRM